VTFREEGGKKIAIIPLKPVQQVAITVDFPQIVVDWGRFYEGSSPRPLRMLLNGEFSVVTPGEFWEDGRPKRDRIVGRGFSLAETKLPDGSWGLSPQNTLVKIAKDTGLIGAKGSLKRDQIGELIGRACQWQMRLYMKPGNKGGKAYFTEEIKLAGIIPEGVPVPDMPEEDLFMLNWSGGVHPDPDAVKVLRRAVKNTIRRASNYAGSTIEPIINQPPVVVAGNSAPTPVSTAPAPKKAAPKAAKPTKFDAEAVEFEEDSLPF